MISIKKSKSKNHLLLRDAIGKPKPSTFDLPTMDYAYGRASEHDLQGVKELTTNWSIHKKSSLQNFGNDFRVANREALKSRITNSRQLTAFRMSS